LTPAGAAAFALLVALLPGAVRFHLPQEASQARVLYYAEGPSATVHVVESEEDGRPHRTLLVDSKSVAGTYDEIVTDQKMLAHLPLLLHPAPQRALTVGFGTGGTSYSMLQHKIEVHCVEIEPRVPDAFRWFESQNRGIVGPGLDRLDFRLILDDARAWLHVAPQPYDVIVTDLTSIQYRGNGNLYTAECFQRLRSQLTPAGVGAAWVPITGITPEALRVLTRTFRSVFPHTSVWYMINLPTDFVILVGTPAPLEIRMDDWRRRSAATLVQRDLALVGMESPEKLAACLILAENDVARFTSDGPLHTDDRPLLDYLTHASPYQNTFQENMRALLEHRSDPRAYLVDAPPASRPAADAALDRWLRASQALIAGHIAYRTPTPDRGSQARRAYEAAVELVPEDARTRALLQDLE
jgi:spermidine synthase